MRFSISVASLIALSLGGFCAFSQQGDEHLNPSAQELSLFGPEPITGHPFSATKYVETVKVLADGTRLTTRQEHNVFVARDAEGRVRVDTPTDRPFRKIEVYNPAERTIHFWLQGERAAEVSAIVPLTDAQVRDLPQLSATLKGWSATFSTAQAHQVRANQQEESIGNIPVKKSVSGFLVKTASSGPDNQVTIKRTVWTSAEMKLVVKSVTFDPRSGETTTVGLENVSLAPDDSLFQQPAGYEVQHNKQRGPDSLRSHLTHLVEGDIL
jgi:hypothetical protein